MARADQELESVRKMITKIVNDQDYLYGADYQREVGVWSPTEEHDLIHTILYEMDMPKFYLDPIESDNPLDDKYYFHDGQQRSNTLVRFYNNEFSLPKSFELPNGETLSNLGTGECKYKDLPKDYKEKFLSSKLTVVRMFDYTDEEIELQFLRLQKGKPLTGVEKRHAVKGQLTKLVMKLISHKVLRKYYKPKNRRYAHEEVIAKILYLISMKGPATIGQQPLMKFYCENREYNKDSKPYMELKSVLNYMYKACRLSKFKIPSKNLFIMLAFSIWKLKQEYNIKDKEFDVITAFIKLNGRRLKNEKKPVDEQEVDLTKFHMDLRDGQRKDSIERSSQFIIDYIVDELNLVKIDLKSPITDEERFHVFSEYKGICQGCSCQCDIENFHVDHIEPRVIGGTSDVDNYQLMCPDCNLAKGAKDFDTFKRESQDLQDKDVIEVKESLLFKGASK
jgi:5-methylcytosine-specific restriction endonuclease McrA